MGVFDWPIRVSSPDGPCSVDIEAIVDTGATYTALPTGVLKQLGVVPARRHTFELADGRCQVMEVGSAPEVPRVPWLACGAAVGCDTAARDVDGGPEHAARTADRPRITCSGPASPRFLRDRNGAWNRV